jgi:hypothetical protein
VSVSVVDDAAGVGSDASHSSTHLATTEGDLESALTTLALPWDEYAFVDIGSGLGRAVMLAALRPFRRIVGVEFAKSLHDASVENVKRFETHLGRPSRIELVHADAVATALPAGPLVVYLYQPFDEPTFERFVSLRLEPRANDPDPVFVIYVAPRHRRVFDGRMTFRVVAEREAPIGRPGSASIIYKVVQSGAQRVAR